MCAAINSDEERYANESFESASENEILEMSDLESESSGDSDEDVLTVNEFKRYSNRTVKSNQKREPQPLRVQKKYVNNGNVSSTSNSPITSEDDDDDDDDDEDDKDIVMKGHNIADIKTLTMSFDTDGDPSDRSAANTGCRRSIRQNRENDYKQPLQDVIEQNENSEYYTEDEDYQNIQKMERLYKTNLMKNQQLSGKKDQTYSAINKVYEETTSEESEEVDEESEFDENDNDFEIPEESGKEQSEDEQQQPSSNQPKIALNLEKGKSNMTTNETDIVLTSKMLQPVESLSINFNQLKLPNSEQIAMSLIKAVKSSIMMQSNSLHSIDEKQENKQSVSKEESQNEEDNMEKQEKEVNHTKISDKEDELNDTEEDSQFDEKRLTVYQPNNIQHKNNIQSMVQRFYEEPITYSLSTRSACHNQFKSDDSLFLKSHFKSLQRIPTHDAHKLKPHPRKSWSFTNERMREIERHNQILLRKILSQKPSQKFQPPKMLSRERSMQHCAARVTSSSLNRKKQQRQINLDNHVLQRKIEAISLRRPVLP